METKRNAAACLFTLALALSGCSSSTDGGEDVGGLKVSVTTEGGKPDVDGYTVQIEGHEEESVPANGQVTVTGLAPGNYVTRLAGLASNCYVSGANPRTVAIQAGSQATADFTVTCPVTGARISVTTEAVGNDYDENGYFLKIGNSYPRRVPARGVTIFGAETEGVLPIEITEVAPNCSPDPANPSTITTAAGQESQLTLRFTCANVNGALHVAVSTTGPDVQSAGFGLELDFSPLTLDATNAALLPRVPGGEHTLGVDTESLQPNCRVSGPNPRTVSVAIADTTEVTIAVVCTAVPKVVVTASTSGADLDTDGYTVTLYSPTDYYYGTTYEIAIPANGTVRSPYMRAGTYQGFASGISSNCQQTGLTPIPVTLGATDVALNLTVHCNAARQLAFVTGTGAGSEISVGSELGTSLQLTHNAVADSNPAWSPDGQQLAFASSRDGNSEIYAMNADGSNVRRLTTNAAADYEPTWSSDGTRIAFVSERDGNREIYVMDQTGLNPVRLTNNPGLDIEPAWSPSGNHILFARGGAFNLTVTHVMNFDGSGVTSLGTGGNRESSPVWSPNGAQIAFVRMDASPLGSLRIMNADGTGVHERQLNFIGPDLSWAPDERIAFIQPDDCYFGCYGTSLKILWGNGTVGLLPWLEPSEPAWRP